MIVVLIRFAAEHIGLKSKFQVTDFEKREFKKMRKIGKEKINEENFGFAGKRGVGMVYFKANEANGEYRGYSKIMEGVLWHREQAIRQTAGETDGQRAR